MAESISYRLALDNADYVRGMKEAQSEVRELSATTRSANLGALSGELQLASGSMSNFSRNAKESRSSFSQFIENLKSGSGSFAGITAGAAGAGAAITAFSVTTAAAMSVLESYASYDGLVRGLKTIEGTAAATTARIEELRNVAKTPGLGFEEAVRADIRLRSVGLTAEQSSAALRAFGNALATVGGGKAELDGVILALGQIAAKGSVSAEEINQIAERVPQVRAAMKDAFGTADTEALQKAGIGATEFISGLVAELAKLPQVTGGARNELDNYADAWGALKTQASEFGVELAGGWIRNVTQMMGQARKDLQSLRDFMGIKTPGLGGADGVTEEQRLAEAAAQAKADAEAAAAAEAARLANANAEFWERKEAEKTAATQREAARRAEIDKAELDRRRAAAERDTDAIARARLSPEDYLKRQIAATQAQGATGSDAINAAATDEEKSRILARTATLIGLQKQLADLQAAAAQKATSEAEQAERKAAAEAKALASRREAAADFAAQDAILAARAAGDDRRVKRLEREAAIEATKRRLIKDQGLDAANAQAAAERRQALEEAAANRADRPNRIRLADAEASRESRAARMSAADRARAARFAGIDAAQAAANQAVAAKPAAPKDHTLVISKKLDQLEKISGQLDAVAKA